MKYLSILFLLTLLMSCKEDKGTPAKLPSANNNTVKATPAQSNTTDKTTFNSNEGNTGSSSAINNYLTDIKSFSDSEKGNPIEKFKTLAENTATQKINITKDNFANALKTAANFKYLFITVENHTVIKIDDVSKCKPSGSWSTCVPFAHGYIKKGEMVYQEDYANNIMGLPDNQTRTMYLFD